MANERYYLVQAEAYSNEQNALQQVEAIKKFGIEYPFIYIVCKRQTTTEEEL
ncbi:hypothetical protein GLW08_06835 [Pontibacillus yanchengensis]|uniref:Uncharacterized protein n=2 Tax=Pontibacillus yanchengensis TaxID=462910 RepID=A0ACC7VE47_9BACI|nr:hypothetical protein [Pontibacillus yanchengensis]MYL32471.1 hypothetical protein [Pontibacillus yanchengensis]MYL53052.1 hypothetical protein [Pontibacillus yanchengensis]